MGNEASAPSPHGSGGGARGVEPEADKMRNIQRMDASLRKKLRGGVHYNMKVVLKGERGSGKSALLRRLQGLPFIPEYTPTPQIQTGTINWSFKNSEDTVKVEVWDVVDKGIRVKPGETPRLPPEDAAGVNAEEEDAPAGLPFEYTVPSSSSSGSSAFGVLDAGMVDVYQQCQCAMFVIRPDSATALDYLRKELPQVPPSIPVLLLLNFRDTLAGGHVITMAELRSQIMAGQACEGRTRVHAFECSMLNCYGLRTLYAYLGVPFLLMKAETIRRQLSQAEEDLTASEAELAGMVEDDGYDKYVEGMQTRRAKAPPPPPPATSSPSPARAPPPASPARVPTEQAATSSPAVVMLQHARPPPPPLPEPARREDSGGGGEKKKKGSGSKASSPDKKQKRRQKHHKGGNTVMAAAGAAAMGEPEAAPNLTDVMEFSVDAGNKELDDFFGHDDEEEGEEEERRRREEEYARISACLKPEARQQGGKKASRGSRASSSSSTAGMFMEAGDDDEEEDEGAFVYVGLKPVNLNIPSRPDDIPSSAAAPTDIREEAGEEAAAAKPPLQPVMRTGSSGSALDDVEMPPVPSDIPSPAVSVGRTGEEAAAAAVASKAEEEGGGKGPTTVVEETGAVVEEGEGDSAADATSASSMPPPPATAAAAAVEEDDAAGEGEKREEEEEPARVAEEDTAAVAAPLAVKEEEEGPEEEEEGEEGIDGFVPSTVDLNFGDDEEEDKVLSGISPARLHNKLGPPAGMVVDDDDEEDDDGLTALEKLGSGRQVDLDDSDVENEGPASRPLTISPATVIKPVPQALPMGRGIDVTPAQSAAGLSEAARAAIAATMASLGQEVGGLDGDAKKKKRSKEKEGRRKEKKQGSSSRSRKKSSEAVGGGEDDL